MLKNKNPIRKSDFFLQIGGESSIPFSDGSFKPFFGVEISLTSPKNSSQNKCLKDCWKELGNNPVEWAIRAEKLGDFIAVAVANADVDVIKEISEKTTKPLIITVSDKVENNTKIISSVIKNLTRKAAIGIITEDNHRDLVEEIKPTEHSIIARTPMDINLAKELNILLTESGISHDRIIIDPTSAALGYSLDYSYSMNERIKLAGLDGDTTLNMPLIAFAGEEVFKAKEAKSEAFDKNWGDFNTRAISWEIMTASAMVASGANIILLRHKESLRVMNSFRERFIEAKN